MPTFLSLIAIYAVLNYAWMYLFKLGPFTPHPFMTKIDGMSGVFFGLLLVICSIQLLLKTKLELTTKEIIWNLYKIVLALYLLFLGHHFVSGGWNTLSALGREKNWWSLEK